MPVPTRISASKNIWVAAGDGDLERVKELVEKESISPNAPDQFTYTPMHAAASYGHIDMLQYLISKGGDVNVTDEDNDTPLYTVESVEVAQWLIDHGAKIDWRNNDDVTPYEHLEDEFPDIARYLVSRLPNPPESNTSTPDASQQTQAQPSQYTTERTADQLTSRLMSRVGEVMQRAEANGSDPEEELRQIVSETVLEGMLEGVQLSERAEESGQARGPHLNGESKEDTPHKRSRLGS